MSGLLWVRPEQPWCWKLTPVYSACQEAYTIYCTLEVKTPQNDSSSLFAVSYRNAPGIRVISLLVHRVTFIHKRISPGSRGAIKWDCWLVENSEQSGFKLVFRIYPLPRWTAMPQNGAALWI